MYSSCLLSSAALLPAGGALWRREGYNPTFNDTSFSTQSTQVLAMPAPSAVQGKLQARAEQQRAQFVYIADRFEPYIAQNQTGRYVWLPLRVTASGVRVQWSDEWTY